MSDLEQSLLDVACEAEAEADEQSYLYLYDEEDTNSTNAACATPSAGGSTRHSEPGKPGEPELGKPPETDSSLALSAISVAVTALDARVERVGCAIKVMSWLLLVNMLMTLSCLAP